MIDDLSGLCVGCGRSTDEIAGWIDMNPTERRSIMAALPGRLLELERESGAGGAKS
jgi:predicted Fe-S protein YdhL (DUF1289 family)